MIKIESHCLPMPAKKDGKSLGFEEALQLNRPKPLKSRYFGGLRYVKCPPNHN